MNILWFSPTPSHPQNAGNRSRIFSLVKYFQNQGHHITFVYFSQEGNDAQTVSAMEAEWDQFQIIPFSGRNRQKSKGDLWGVDDWYEQAITENICALLRQKSFDVVFCEYIFQSKVLEFFPAKCIKVIDTHDRFGGRAELLKRNGIEPDFFYTTPEQEVIALNRADVVIAIQEEEAEYYRSITSAEVVVIGHVLEETTWQWSLPEITTEKRPLRIGYFGSGNSLNRKSINQFLEAYYENKELVFKSELILAGSICQNLKIPENIQATLMGKIDQITDFYSAVDIAINPMIDGTGLKIKTIEALNFGVPIVSTVSGSDGLPVTAPFHLSENPQKLVSYLSNIYKHNQLSEIRQESLVVINNYKNQLAQQLNKILKTIKNIFNNRSQKKTIVVVTDAPFWEGNNGKHERILSLCNELKKHCLLKVFFLGSIWAKRSQEIVAQGYEGIVVSFKDYEQGELAEDLPQWTDFADLQGLKRWRHSAFYRSFAKFIAAQKPNLVVLEYIYLAYLRDAIPNTSISVLDTHDIMCFREYRFYNYGFDHHISISLAEEKKILERFDTVIAIQEQEYKLFQKIVPNIPVLLCPHAISTKPEFTTITSPIRSIGFIGGSSLANKVGLEWFLKQVWPVIKTFNLQLLIFGSIGEQFTEYCEQDSNVKNMASSLSQEEIYQMTDCMINPIFVGGGLKIKTLEAITYGKPIVSTEEGAVGIGEEGNNGIILARNRSQFIDAFIRLVYEPKLVQQLIEQSQKLVQTKFSPEVCYGSLIDLANYS
ncbi:MAG: glycosyltransferase family 4 protein [Patescibacteria group bacterium]